MRLLITILLFAFAVTTKSNVFAGNANTDVLVTQRVNTHLKYDVKLSDVASKNSIEGDDLKRGDARATADILHILSHPSHPGLDVRHFLDAFFISYFAYSSFNYCDTCYYGVSYIAANTALLIIFPYHSFW